MMTYDFTCHLLLVPLTLALVSAVRRVAPAVDGRLAVLAVATLVGVALSYGCHYAIDVDVLPAWGIVARGASAAAIAYGVTSRLSCKLER